MPENWKTYKLEDLASIKGGKRMPKGVALIETPTDHPYIRVTDMGQRKVPLDQLLYVPDEVFDKISRYIVSKDDVILSIVGTIGAVAIISDELHNANLTENCVKLTELKNIHNSFLYYFLKSNIGQNEIAKGIVGSTQPKLPLYSIQNIDIELPPLQEQKSIASILSALDDKIELNLQMNKTLEEMAMALYKHWFVDFGPFRDGEFVDSELGEIPKGWEVKELQHLALFKNGKGIKRDFFDEKGDYKVFGSNGIIGRTNKQMFKKPVIAIGRVGANYGEVHYSVEPCWISDNAVTVQPKIKDDFWWLLQSLRLIDYKNFVGGSAQPLITQGAIKQVKFAVPKTSFLTGCSIKLSLLFNQIENNNSENQTLTELRDTLLPKLISGEVRVRDAEKTLSEVI